ncbi:MAG: PAS domain S-box protein [Gemmatirosa sp.]
MAKRILIVQHDAPAARALEERLLRMGYAVAGIAGSAQDAAAVTTAAAPDLLLVDAALHDACAHLVSADTLRAAQPLPILAIGAEGEAPERSTSGDGSSRDFVVTSGGDRELRATIELAICRVESARAVHELESFFAISRDLFCFLDFSGYWRRLNPAWEHTLGFTREELMSRPFIEFVHPDDRERTLQQNGRVRQGGETRGFENRYLCKDGSYRWLLWNSIPQSSERVIYAVARDITARKAAEDERARLVQELQASLAEVRSLREILPICSYCRKIRDDENYWQSVESYIARHTRTRFSHGICPSCMTTEVEPQLAALDPD